MKTEQNEELAPLTEHQEKRYRYLLKLDQLEADRDTREPDKLIPAWAEPLIQDFYKEKKGYSIFAVRPGQFFLGQRISSAKNTEYMSRPILGMCVEFDVYDQAGVIRYIEPTRTWQNNKLGFTKEAVISEFVCWQETMIPFAIWTGFPTYKELIKAYRSTYYYGKPERVNTINEILQDLK